MKNLAKNIAIAFIIFLAIASIFAMWQVPLTQPEEISLSEVTRKINNNEVEKIEVEENKLKIKPKDGEEVIARKEVESSLTETLKNYGVDQSQLNQIEVKVNEKSGLALFASNILPFLIPFAFIGVFIYFMTRSLQKGNNRAMMFGQSSAKKDEQKKDKKKTTFKDVAGSQEVKEELWEVVDFLKSPKKFKDLGAEIPKGVLLMGPPGTGKTLMARAVSGEAGVPFFHISGSEFVEMFVGVGASRVRSLFNKAKKNSPCIVFVDEIDAVGRQRGAGLGGSHDEREQTLNQILTEMDGFEQDNNVIVIAATNRPDVLDPALLRPGRFDRRVTLGLPDIKDRTEILKIHAKGKPMASDVDLKVIAQRTPGFSGADLKNLLNEGAILTAKEGKKKVTLRYILDSIEKVMLGPERKSAVMTKREKDITAYHEAGHALVTHLLPNTDPVQKVSIVSRGRAAGYTLKLPDHDKHFHSKSEFLDDLAVMMGGYVTEKSVFGDITTGATNDLSEATKLARRLVMQYGMSDKLGPMTFGQKDELVFLGKDLSEQRDYSEEVAAEIDKEVRNFIDQGYKKAEQIINENKEKLDKIYKRLIKNETIERKEFDELMSDEIVKKKENKEDKQ